MPHDTYENPLSQRYASREMLQLWSPQRKFGTWRRLWLALAEAEAELGLPITGEQLEELRAHLDDIDFDAAARYEKQKRHDVMAHVATYGDVCPAARPIIHLGATSCFVTDNTDLLLLREGLQLIAGRLAAVIDKLARFAKAHQDLPCLGYTHYQPAQPTTVGKRACLWAYDLVLDLTEVEHRLTELKARGVKGTTGTQASFLALLDGDHARVRRLDELVCLKMGLPSSYAVTGQTYPRKIDSQVLNVLSGIAQSAHKFGMDLRLLQHDREMEEPFEASQVGSSAMAYKRNPMRAERICGLARYVISLESSTANTAATQWMERTLDDSANRRLVLPQAMLAADAILLIYQNVASGLVVHPAVIGKRLDAELPFMATENVLMAAVQRGGDRQHLHERIRVHSQEAAARIKAGEENDLLARLQGDPAFEGIDVTGVYTGRAAEQVDEFVDAVVEPIRARYGSQLAQEAELRV